MNKGILDKVDEIINEIENGPEYHQYLLLKEKMQNDKELMKLINEVKVLQKDVVHHLDKKELLQEKMDALNDYPLYREYNNTLYEINNIYAIVENTINGYFKRIMNEKE